nr:hypothetical protein C5F59_31430 [Streptomyces sp. QL37]
MGGPARGGRLTSAAVRRTPACRTPVRRTRSEGRSAGPVRRTRSQGPFVGQADGFTPVRDNVAGNTVNVVGLLNPAFGNFGLNG